MMNRAFPPNLIDWDYWPYLWVVHSQGRVCMKDYNGWLYFTDSATLGM